MNIHLRNILFLLYFISMVTGFIISNDTRAIVIYGIGAFVMGIIVLDSFNETYFKKKGDKI